MFSTQKSDWSPLHFLAALGAGGLVVTFFMFLLFWVPHPNHPIPLYEDILSAYSLGNAFMQTMITTAITGIAVFTLLHIALLVWNLKQYTYWKTQQNLSKIEGTNAHTQLLAIPLTLAMSINAGFIGGAVFIPQLWSVVEVLFPFALSGFVLLGIWAMRLYFDFFSHSVSKNSFNSSLNNSLAQLMPGFAFAMISVGLAAPAAMSLNTLTVTMSIILASLFIVPAVFISVVKIIIGISHMLEHGANKSTLPTLWVGVPILTTLSIAVMRLDHGLAQTLHLNESHSSPLLFLTLIVSAQLFLILLGAAVMKRMAYFKAVWNGEEKSPVMFALICPGVALSISLQFFINKGLVAAHLIEKFSVTYWSLSAVAIAIQIFTAIVLVRFLAQLFEPQGKTIALTA